MDTLLQIGFSNALAAAILAIPAALASRYLRHRPALVHALWLLVLLKLVTPPLLTIPFPWSRSSAPLAEPTLQEEVGCPHGVEPPVVRIVAVQEEVPLETFSPPKNSYIHWQSGLAVGWLGGTVLVWGLAWRRLTRLGRLFRDLPVAPDDLQALVDRQAQRMGVTHVPRVWLVPAVVPPLLLALGR
jgi:hypothetical protein